MPKNALLIMRSSEENDNLDGMRSVLGLGVGNHYAYGVMMNVELSPMSEYNQESLEMIRDLEIDLYTNVQANVEKNDLTPITLEEVGEMMRDMDFIIPYGVQD